MKKLNYILITFLLLFVNNFSFGQVSPPGPAEQEQCLQIKDKIINLSLNEGDEVDISLIIQYNGILPSFQGGRSTVKIVGPQKVESSRQEFQITPQNLDVNVNIRDLFLEILTNNATFSAEDVGQYTVYVEKEGCFGDIGVITLSLIDGNAYCHLPSIFKENKDYITDDELNFSVRKYVTDKIASVNDLEINITGPNGYNSGNIQWSDDTLNKIFNINNSLALADSGWYYVTFTQTGCSTVVDSTYINIISGLKLPFRENFENVLTPSDNNLFKFKGSYNTSNRRTNWYCLNEIIRSVTYNSLIHFADSAITTPDTIFLPKFITDDNYYKSDPNLKLILKFNVSHLLKDSTSNSYDTLILKAYLGNNPTPIQLYKKGGFDLRTDEMLDTNRASFLPIVSSGYLWRTETLYLNNIDTSNVTKLFFILKPSTYDIYTTPSNNVLLDDIKLEYTRSIQDYSFGNITITADSLFNKDKVHTVTINVSNNHNATAATLYRKQKHGLNPIRGTMLYKSDTTFTFISEKTQNGKVHYVASLLDTTGIFEKFSNEIVVKTNCKPPISAPTRFIVDSSFNRNREYKLSVFLPPNHNSDIIKFYDNDSLIKVKVVLTPKTIYTHKVVLPNGDTIDVENSKKPISRPSGMRMYELLSDTSINIQNFQNGSTLIEYTRTNVPNGLHRHSVALGNTDFGFYEFYEDDSLRLVYHTDTLDVIVDTVTIPLGDPSLITNVAITNDGKYNLTLTIPTRHNAFKYELLENGVVVASDFLTSNNRTTVAIPFEEKTRGSYTYAVRLTNRTGQIINSNLTVNSNYFKPPVINARACTTNRLVAPNRKRSNFTYSFTLNDNCPTNSYKALFYSGQNVGTVSASNPSLTQNELNRLTWRPEGGSPRNSGLPNGNILFTRNELTSKTFSRVANPLPALANRWYKIEIECTSCSQSNRKRVGYFFVTN